VVVQETRVAVVWMAAMVVVQAAEEAKGVAISVGTERWASSST
jgi:hypothetical protein